VLCMSCAQSDFMTNMHTNTRISSPVNMADTRAGNPTYDSIGWTNFIARATLGGVVPFFAVAMTKVLCCANHMRSCSTCIMLTYMLQTPVTFANCGCLNSSSCANHACICAVFRLQLFVIVMLPAFLPVFFHYIFSRRVIKNICYG
jgi:hypothetical protein